MCRDASTGIRLLSFYAAVIFFFRRNVLTMEIIFALTVLTIRFILSAVTLAMFVRAVLSFFPIEEGAIHSFLALITEPFILPIRILFDKLNIATGIPLDIPFFVSYLLLTILTMFL